MSDFDRKKHWENIYETKPLTEVSWYQPLPETSIRLLGEIGILADSSLIDIGGGDSFLVDYLLKKGIADITVLDISAKAIERAKERLGTEAQKVTWIQSDISQFTPTTQYDIWHDRAAFHFLTEEKEIEHYVEIASESVKIGGHLVLGTFSDNGPKKCSGIEIKQYSQPEMTKKFARAFRCVKCFNEDHNTPFNTFQNFTFGVFKRT